MEALCTAENNHTKVFIGFVKKPYVMLTAESSFIPTLNLMQGF